METSKEKPTSPAESKETSKSANGTKMKSNGTPDKRFKGNKSLKNDGTPDKRYKANKTGASSKTTK